LVSGIRALVSLWNVDHRKGRVWWYQRSGRLPHPRPIVPSVSMRWKASAAERLWAPSTARMGAGHGGPQRRRGRRALMED